MERVSILCLVTMVGCLLTGGSLGYCGHGHSSHGSTHAASHPAASHPAPKHPAAKPPKSNAHQPEARPKGHDSHNSGAAKPNGGPSKQRKANSMAGVPKSHEKAHDHDHDPHHDHDHRHHGHRYWNGHEWVDGVVVDGATATDGSTGVVVPVDGVAAPAVVAADTAAPIASSGPQILFSVDPQERDSYEAAAHAAGMSRSEWIRSRLNAAVQHELK